MKNFDYYKIREFFYKNGTNNTNQFKLIDLSIYLNYSKKTTSRKLILYNNLSYLKFSPGKGRGHLSKVIFEIDFHEEIIKIQTCDLVTCDFILLLKLSQLDIPKDWFSPFINEINKHFSPISNIKN